FGGALENHFAALAKLRDFSRRDGLFRDVLDRTDRSHNMAVLADDDAAAALESSFVAVGAEDALLEADRLGAAHIALRFDSREDSIPIVRVDHRHEQVDGWGHAHRIKSEDRKDLVRPDHMFR